MKTLKNKKHYKKNKRGKFRKTNNISKSSKKKIGGTPKINFAYTYLIINYENFQKFPLLNTFLLKKTQICDCISIGTSIEKCTLNYSTPFLNNSSEKCILVLKYDDLVRVTSNTSLLNDEKFLELFILGHAKTIQKENMIGIYNVCLHLTNKVGYGTVLFNIILTAIYSYSDIQLDKTNLRLWLGIRLDNIQFSKLAYLYTMKGFNDPLISSKDMYGNELPFKIVELTKNFDTYVTNEDTVFINYAKTMDLYYQAKQSLQKNNLYACKLKFQFDKSAILNLRLFPYSGDKGITNVYQENLQREYSGIFHIFNAYIKNESVIYKLSLETLAENKGIKYLKGTQENVLLPEGDRTFHTHPIVNYIKYQVLIATPSGQDFTSFYKNFYKLKNSQFHAVISIEGIYFISLSKNTLLNATDLTPQLDNIHLQNLNANYEYPYTERYFDWKMEGNFDESIIPGAIQKYLLWFQKQNKNYNDLFNLQFIPWKKLQKDTIIEVYYPKLNGHCYCEDDFYNL
jgi:hypothetical protein